MTKAWEIWYEANMIAIIILSKYGNSKESNY